MGLGVQFRRSQTLSLVLMLDYSAYHFSPVRGTTVTNSPTAEVADLSISAKLASNELYLLAAIGYTHEHRDDAAFEIPSGWSGSVGGADEFRLFLNLGFGVQFSFTEVIGLFVQTNFRFRDYSTLSLEIGFSFGL